MNTRAAVSIRPDVHFIADFAEQHCLGSPSTLSCGSQREVHAHLQSSKFAGNGSVYWGVRKPARKLRRGKLALELAAGT
jgi:hypothetical protein